MLQRVLASRIAICYLAAPSNGISGGAGTPEIESIAIGNDQRTASDLMMTTIDASGLMQMRTFIQARQDEIVQDIRRLVEIESPSGDVEGSSGVNALLAGIAGSIPSVTSIERIESPSCGQHLLLRAFGENANGSKPTLILGHTDTVHPRGTLKVHFEEGRLFGPGVLDMKGSCVIALEALRTLTVLNLRPPRGVTLLLTCDEEIGSATGRPLVENQARQAEQVLVLEPPAAGGLAKTARKGVAVWTIEAQGVASHAGLEPEKGASAILELARQTARLHSLNDPASTTTFNVGLISGGTRSNVVAARAKMEIDTRFSTFAEARRVESLMATLAPFDKRISLTVNGGVNRGPLERTAAVAKLFHRAQGIAGRLGFELGECSVGGASDGNFAAAMDVPVLDGLGVDGDGAHALHEHILLSDIARRTALLAGLIATL